MSDGGANTAPLSESEDDEIANSVTERSSIVPQTLNVQDSTRSPQQTSPPSQQLSPLASFSGSSSPRHTGQSISSPHLHTPNDSR